MPRIHRPEIKGIQNPQYSCLCMPAPDDAGMVMEVAVDPHDVHGWEGANNPWPPSPLFGIEESAYERTLCRRSVRPRKHSPALELSGTRSKCERYLYRIGLFEMLPLHLLCGRCYGTALDK